MKTKCAWCGKILSDDGHTDAASPVSHGMCRPLCDEAKAMGWSDDITVTVPDTNKPLVASLIAGLLFGCFTVSASPARPLSDVKQPIKFSALCNGSTRKTETPQGGVGIQTPGARSIRAALISDSFISRVEQIESGGNARAIGDNGKARGSFQFHAAAWQMVNNSRVIELRPTAHYESRAHDRKMAREFAFDYFTILQKQFVKAGKNPTQADLYAAWNLGFGGYRKRGFDLSRCPTITQRACEKLK